MMGPAVPRSHAMSSSDPAGPEEYTPGRGAQTHLATDAIAYLLAGPFTFGGIGFGLDYLLGTWFVLPLGVLAGMGLSIYLLWLRYGTP